MIFTQGVFFVFFLVVGAVYWALRTNRSRKVWLLAASYVFYGSWDWRFLGLIVFSTFVDYFSGLGIERAPDKAGKRRWLYASLVANLGLLGFFKYFNFFVENGVGLLNLLGAELAPMRLDIVLPVGISFYTFQSLSYSIDVYRSGLATRKDPLDFALFVAFFPQLVAGPIVRAKEFLPQLDVKRRLADVPFRASLTLFFFGFVKKACVSDQLAPIVERVFEDPGAAGTAATWIGSWLFTIQLYCDFSGYSDMAYATAGLLGYTLVENFRHPFVSRSVGEFWSRWHISLTSWIRDYLYIWLDAVWTGLGGKRTSKWRIYSALLGVYTAVGLWHGASWTFVIFGVVTGVFVVLETAEKVTFITKRAWLAYPYVLLFWTVCAVLFRAGELSVAGDYFATMLGGGPGPGADAGDALSPVIDPRWALAIPAFLAVHVVRHKRILHDRVNALPDVVYAALLGLGVALALPWVKVGYQAFVYFQF